MFRRSSAGQITVVVGKAYDRVHIGDVDPLGIGSGRIERNTKRRIQSRREDLHLLGPAIRSDSAKNLNVAAVGFSQENVTIGSGPHQARIAESSRIQLYVETCGRLWPSILGPRDHRWTATDRLCVERRGKISEPDARTDAWLIEAV